MAHCIKANYWKMSCANFIHKDGLLATGIMEIYEYETEDNIAEDEQRERAGNEDIHRCL